MTHYPTGVAVAAAVGADGGPIGLVVGTFTSVSLAPPLVAFFPSRSSGTFALMRRASSFAVSVLGVEHDDVRRSFSRRDRARRWHGVDWHHAPAGAPVIDGAPAWVECTWTSVEPAGDHFVVIGQVTALGAGVATSPLVFHEGRYDTVRRQGERGRQREIA
jgi:flavin reductase (DIM6/NTAB) family NADH-FMN oxidoreductase RutF